MRIAAAIVTEQGRKDVARRDRFARDRRAVYGRHRNARKLMKTGQPVTVSCAEGEEGYVYKDILPFEVKKTEIKPAEKTKTKIMMNVGDPDNAFALSFLPSDGVGLARENSFLRILFGFIH